MRWVMALLFVFMLGCDQGDTTLEIYNRDFSMEILDQMVQLGYSLRFSFDGSLYSIEISDGVETSNFNTDNLEAMFSQIEKDYL